MFVIHVVLRLVHIFAGVFWAGVAFMIAGLLTPAAARMRPAGERMMGQRMHSTQLS